MKTMMITALTAMALSTAAIADTPFLTNGFEMPESVTVNDGSLIVSNIVGSPLEADANGYLSRLSLDGAVIDKHWVTGLDAPKGMAVLGDQLIVADLTAIHVIDLASGDHVARIVAEGAVFLNDVAAGDGVVYISDMMTHQIWAYSNGILELWLEDQVLAHPNGLSVKGDDLVVGSWGAGMRDDFTTETPGSLLSIDRTTKEITVLAAEVGNLDGVVHVGNEIVVSDWITGGIFAVSAAGTVKDIYQGPMGLADISYADGVIYVPLMFDGTVTAIPYP